ncbi:hypothetical protein MHYP_G00266030 [Metynnis hypsauchen]
MGASSSTQVYNASPYEIEVLCPVGKLKKKIVQLDAKSEDDASANEEASKKSSKHKVIEVMEEDRNCSVRLPPGDDGSIKGCANQKLAFAGSPAQIDQSEARIPAQDVPPPHPSTTLSWKSCWFVGSREMAE